MRIHHGGCSVHLIKLLFYRHRSLFRHIRKYGISNGWWMWGIENTILCDVNGDEVERIIYELKKTITQARWHDNEELANGIESFIVDIKTFQFKCHPHLMPKPFN